ncbi:MAG: stage sporulation protein [Clostridia bacterium]|jgi:stage III sporulation protein AB|nr:stage sporulation protein [Clostridia bacterium]
MTLKLIGGLLIMAACSLYGIAASNRYSLRPKDIRKLRSALQMLETEVIFGSTPLPAAMNNVAKKVDGGIKSFFSRVSQELLSGWSYDLDTVWSGAMEELQKETCLTGVDKELLKDFGKVLGCSDREDQKKHFELFYIQLKHHEDMAEEERRKNEKLYKSLGFLAGLVIFIMLI